MPFQYSQVGRALFIKADPLIGPEDIPILRALIKDAKQRANQKLICFFITGSPSSPSVEMRREGIKLLNTTEDLWEFLYVVLAMGGLRAGLIRSVIAGMILFSGRGGKRLSVHDSLENALSNASARLPQTPAEIVEVLARPERWLKPM